MVTFVRVTGWAADIFRIALAMIYWNTRKSWFRLRRGRERCPCQNPSDSGRALETACEACHGWDRPGRFRHVCPLLVETPKGLRCSVNAADVRPFWRRTLGYYGVSLGAIYLCGALIFFTVLRLIGYPVNVFHVIWPPAWHHLREVRGGFFVSKANRAFAAGHKAEGLLFLTNAYELDPQNYAAGVLLAKTIHLSQPNLSDGIFSRLMADHPLQRTATAQEWFRALLPRGDYNGISRLARDMVIEDGPHASVWMRALLFATRQLKTDTPLRELLASEVPAARPWRPLLEVELRLRAGRASEVRSALRQLWTGMPAFANYFQIETLIQQGDAMLALDLLAQYGRAIDDEARATLQLEAFALTNSASLTQQLASALLSAPPNLPTIKILTAHLVRHPDQAVLDGVYANFLRADFAVTNDSLGIYFSMFCAAGVAKDWGKVHALERRLKQSTGGNFVMLALLETFFRGDATQTRISAFLPAVPMPLEVTYALLERYPGSTAASAPKATP